MTLLVGEQEGHPALKKPVLVCWWLCTSYSSSCHHHLLSSLVPIKSRMETLWYWLTQVHLVNGG